jgi:hypothetical protein
MRSFHAYIVSQILSNGTHAFICIMSILFYLHYVSTISFIYTVGRATHARSSNINWNYGLLPQTWEDLTTANSDVEGAFEDNDPGCSKKRSSFILRNLCDHL